MMSRDAPRVSFAEKLSAAYGFVAFIWIIASGYVLAYFVHDSDKVAAYEAYKGIGFVVVTTVLLYAGLRAQRYRETEVRGAALTSQLEGLADSINDVVLLVDEDGRIVNANDRAVATYGYTRDELLHMNAADLREPGLTDQFAEQMREVRGRGAMVFETVQRRKDGSTLPIEASARVIEVDGRRFVQGVLRDISETKRAQQRILRLNRLYATLSGVDKAIVRSQSREALFDAVCEVLEQRGGFVGAGIGIVDEATRRIVPVAANQSIRPVATRLMLSMDPATPEGRGPAATAVRDGKPYFCNDVFADPNFAPWRSLAAEHGVCATAAIPLRIGGRLVGVLGVYSDIRDFFDAEVQALTEELGADISFALDHFGRDVRRITAEQETIRLSQERDRLLKRLQLEFESMPVACIVSDLDLTIRDWNPAAASIFGYAKDEAVGKSPCDLIVPEAAKDGVRKASNALLAESRAVAHTDQNMTKAGRAITCEWHDTPLRDETGATIGLLSMVQDVTAHLEVDRALKESETMFRSLVEQSISGIYIMAGGKLVYVNPRCAQIMGYEPQELIGMRAGQLVGASALPQMKAGFCAGIFGAAGTAQYEFRARRKDGAEIDVGMHASLVNYRGERAIIGVLQDISVRRREEENAARYVAQLEKSMLGTIDAVSTMIELRDPYTAGHERHVGEIAAAIGVEMGLPDEEVKGLRITGLVHDIGKISVPAEILSKPGKLTGTEFEIIKSHAQLGYDILKSVEFPWPVAQTILQHHERLDGSGYPQGLKGEAIILPARILAVADTVEAMASHRPYRSALGMEAALQEIEQQSGKRYDARVAAACLRLFREKNYALPA